MDELKPCPCCGGNAKRKKNETLGQFVQCTKCGLRTDYYFNEGWATRAWNRRVNE